MGRVWMAGLLVAGALLTGCSGDDGDDPGSDDGMGGDTSSDTGSTGDGGDGGDAGDGGDSGALPRFCDLLTPEQVGEAVGATVTTETGPFDACEFDQEDPRALSGSLGTVEVGTDNGGFESYRSGAGSLENAVEHPLDELGDAFVTTGSFPGGESLQAAGGVLVGGGVVYTVNLAQATGMSEDELVAISEALLQLMLDAA